MKKKELSKTFYILVFLAAVYLAVYVFSEFRGSYLAVGACGIIFLASGYLLAAAFDREKRQQEEERFQSVDQLNQQIKEIIKIQKALYTAIKKENSVLSEKLDALTTVNGGRQEELLEKIVQTQGQLISETKRMTELQINALKTVAKYNKENARQLALNANENADRIVESVQANIDNLKHQIENLELYKTPFQKENNIGYSNFENADKQRYEIEHAAGLIGSILPEDLDEGYQKDFEHKESSDFLEDSRNLEIESSEISETKPLDFQSGISETSNVADTDQSNLEANEDLKTSETAHQRPEAPVIDDPNRKMTPEEIAQLIAHMTQ